jgi:hypothetical protein
MSFLILSPNVFTLVLITNFISIARFLFSFLFVQVYVWALYCMSVSLWNI